MPFSETVNIRKAGFLLEFLFKLRTSFRLQSVLGKRNAHILRRRQQTDVWALFRLIRKLKTIECNRHCPEETNSLT